MSSVTTRAAGAFLVAWCGSVVSVVLEAPLVAGVCAALGVVAWAIGMRASWRDGRGRLHGRPYLDDRPRDRVARALLLSWLLPGSGELALGLPRRSAIALLAAYLTIAIPAWASVVPYLLAVPFALAVWLAGQIHFRRLSGWGWRPLLPAWGELLRTR